MNVFSKFSQVKLDEVKEDCPNYGMEEKCPDYEVEEDCHKETTSPSEISLKIVSSDTNSTKLLQDPARILPLRVQGNVERDEVDKYYLISAEHSIKHTNSWQLYLAQKAQTADLEMENSRLQNRICELDAMSQAQADIVVMMRRISILEETVKVVPRKQVSGGENDDLVN